MRITSLLSRNLFKCLAASFLLAGCGGFASSRNPAPTPPVTPPAVVSITVAPATSTVQTGQTQQFTAAVTNDSQNKGVTWVLSGTGCSGAACGALSASSSASGAAVTYTAPAAPPAPASVTLTATIPRMNTCEKRPGGTLRSPSVLPRNGNEICFVSA
jgi:hypothetical protein